MDKNLEWAIQKLRAFEVDATPIYVPSPPNSIGFHSYKTTGDPKAVLAESAIIEQILDKYSPAWRGEKSGKSERYRFRQIYEATQRCIALLEAKEDIDAHLIDAGPTLYASGMHPWVWVRRNQHGTATNSRTPLMRPPGT